MRRGKLEKAGEFMVDFRVYAREGVQLISWRFIRVVPFQHK
jgi:hypothetical protein